MGDKNPKKKLKQPSPPGAKAAPVAAVAPVAAARKQPPRK